VEKDIKALVYFYYSFILLGMLISIKY